MNKQKSSKRVFAGIKVSDFIARECVKLQADFSDLPARFIPPKDLHITLLAPWEMVDQSEVTEKIQKAIEYTKPFKLEFNRLSYGPNARRPRLAWIECFPAEELILLKKELLRAFGVEDRKTFRPHVTIARFKRENYKLLRQHPIDKQLALAMPVESVQLFQSPRIGGSGYTVLATFPLPQIKAIHG